MHLLPLLVASSCCERFLRILCWAQFRSRCLTLSYLSYPRKIVNSLNTQHRNSSFLAICPCLFLCCKASITGWTREGHLLREYSEFQSWFFYQLLKIYYAFVLIVVWHIQFLAYRTMVVYRKKSCRLVEPFFHLVHASCVRDICWFGFGDSVPLPILTGTLSRWGQRLQYMFLFVSSFFLVACGYSSHCICSYGQKSYLWVTFLSI